MKVNANMQNKLKMRKLMKHAETLGVVGEAG